MTLVPAKCTQCGAVLEVNNDADAAICKYCGTPFIVEKAITHFNNTYHMPNVQSASISAQGNITVNMVEQKKEESILIINVKPHPKVKHNGSVRILDNGRLLAEIPCGATRRFPVTKDMRVYAEHGGMGLQSLKDKTSSHVVKVIPGRTTRLEVTYRYTYMWTYVELTEVDNINGII